MALTLEDLDRRVTTLEKGAERERTIERAVAEIVSESEQRVRAEMSKSEQRVRAEMSKSEQRVRAEMSKSEQRVRAEMSKLRGEMHAITARVSDCERRFVDLLNDRFDQVMVVLDRVQNPPKA